MNKGGFSWKRLLGISGLKSMLSRKIGMPLTRNGRLRKAGTGSLLALLFVWLIDKQ